MCVSHREGEEGEERKGLLGHALMRIFMMHFSPSRSFSTCLVCQVVQQIGPQLRALDVSFSPLITETALASLLSSCPNLEELDLGNCAAAASDRCGTEAQLDVQGDDWPYTTACLVTSKPQTSCHHVFRILATVISCCRNLGSLYLEFQDGQGASRVSAEAIVDLARGCPKIHVRYPSLHSSL